MTTAPPDEMRVRHLEILQSTINRLGMNSFLVKGWAMTISGGLITVATGGAGWSVALIALLMTTGFWLLDSFYLEQERLFRSLYDRSLSGPSRIPVFSMDVGRYAQSVPWRTVALSRTMTLFYGTFALVEVAVAVALLAGG
ncbi:hypothetical protein [Streptomyces capillispiralis]|uniref:Uncharacterized protein n=1 Tax=Streptomyces capillispiralis TaxID=68182 RepID=A0A561TJW1_9ACTN|nr:hypothetical protein [Streptomyces capillispiralis]TWF87429.1 hypothetical protein FHX78_114438 [Streptomyces capillispiralis]GHH92644.1 hypothetical protein GCM10017779_31010 [Streptomyces capillispiralis]